MGDLNVNSDRFLSDLNELRRIGKVGTGVVRPAFSAADIDARKWLVGKLGQAGLSPQVDAIGNVFGMPQTGKPLLMGSHTDSQPEGGWLDGALGVIAALEIARASVEAGSSQVAVVSFQDEEGRFGGLTGSKIWTGALSQAEADQILDAEGVSLGEARPVIAPLVTESVPSPKDFSAYIEAHIEQGPKLDEAGETVGVVTSLVGSRQLEVTYEGEQNHAGTTPMARRRDAVAGFIGFASALDDRFAGLVTEDTVWTIGQVQVEPNAPSIVPGRVTFSVQWRDASNYRLEQMRQLAVELAESVARSHKLTISLGEHFNTVPQAMDVGIIQQLSAAADTVAPGSWRQMTSGALHDAAHLVPLIPTGMVFTPSIGGLSHCFEEDTKPEHLVACLNVLAEFVQRIPG